MWALRRLNGPQAGQIYMIKPGKSRLGRNPSCELHLPVAGVSKEHLEIQMVGNQVVVKDLQSSNGTYINGVRVQNSVLRLGDKLGVDQILFDVIMAPAEAQHPTAVQHSAHAVVPFQGQALTQTIQNNALTPHPIHYPPHPEAGPVHSGPAVHGVVGAPMGLKQKLDRYMETVVLPGIYSLVEVFPFHSVMMGFAVMFILMVTLLSVVPMNQITSESIKIESQRRALTVARALANSNEKALRSGELSGYSSDLVLREDGISHVYILGKDGSIIAPPEMIGMTPTEIAGFASMIRGQAREQKAEIGGGRIAASYPILVFDPELQQNVAKAHAVVVYDTGSLKFDDGRALSLFVQMLVIAFIVGGVLFFLMYKLIEYPFLRLHSELDAAMRDGRDHTELPIKFPMLQQLLVGINSLLTRAHQGTGGVSAAVASTRDDEWVNMIQLFGYPVLLLSKEMQIIAVNPAFETLTGAQNHVIQGQALAYLPDQALQKNVEELVRQAQNNTQQLHQDRLDISGHPFNLQCQAITVAGEARYYLIGISPSEQAEGGAA